MPPETPALSFTALLVLQALNQGHKFGFDIMQVTGLPSGTIYPALRRLEAMDLVSSDWEKDLKARKEGRPRRRYYELTPAGKRQLKVLPALQGQMGVYLAAEHQPDLILLDIHLPDIDGDEVLRRLHADPRTRDIPVVVVSADATPASIERLHALGASGYLTKPIDIGEFLDTVDRYVGARR